MVQGSPFKVKLLQQFYRFIAFGAVQTDNNSIIVDIELLISRSSEPINPEPRTKYALFC